MSWRVSATGPEDSLPVSTRHLAPLSSPSAAAEGGRASRRDIAPPTQVPAETACCYRNRVRARSGWMGLLRRLSVGQIVEAAIILWVRLELRQ